MVSESSLYHDVTLGITKEDSFVKTFTTNVFRIHEDKIETLSEFLKTYGSINSNNKADDLAKKILSLKRDSDYLQLKMMFDGVKKKIS